MNRILLLLALAALPASADELPKSLHSSVIKIYTTSQKHNWYTPWQKEYQEQSTGSGVIIEGRRILTNAHVVSNQIYLEARRSGDPRRFQARVLFVGHDTELAVLTVDDPAFWEGARPIPLGRTPRQRERLAVYGFPTGGDELSITEGTVSRLDLVNYAHMGYNLLAAQTDAAINPGNSGGPAIVDGRIAGVSFQSRVDQGVENIGYIVPMEMIRRFLLDISDGRYDGIPLVSLGLAKIESEALKRRLRLPPGAAGALVTAVFPGYAPGGEIKPGDAILAVDGREIAGDLTFRHDEDTRLGLFYLFNMKQVGDSVRLKLWRDGRPREEKLVLRPRWELVTGPHYDEAPSYIVHAGLVFTVLTRNYMWHWPPESQHPPFVHLERYGYPESDGERVIILSHILPDAVTAGYTDLNNMIVDKINGRPVRRLAEAAEALRAPLDGFLVVEFDRATTLNSIMVLDAAAAAAAHPAILERSGVEHDRSADLR